MFHHLLRDISVAFAYLKLNTDDVTKIHKCLLKIAAINKQIVHLPNLDVFSIGSLMRCDFFYELTRLNENFPLAKFLLAS